MGITRQLYGLQELDLEIDAGERALAQDISQLGESEALVTARASLTSGQQRLDELKRQQRSAEQDAEDLTSKIRAIDDKLYGGRIRNPKELTDLQHEGDALKAKRRQVENRVLEAMEQVELAEASVARAGQEFKQVEREWQSRQQELSAEIEALNTRLADLRDRRKQLSDSLDPETVALYEKLRKQKARALAKVEQGICRGCRISLSSNEVQQARGGNLVQCSSCGRILYLP